MKPNHEEFPFTNQSDLQGAAPKMTVAEAIATRRSIRAFTNEGVSFDVIERVMEQARLAPSGCNFQPWEATILTGAPLQALRKRLLASEPDDPQEYDFSAPGQVEKYQSRLTTFAASMYTASGIQRDDAEKRSAWMKNNIRGFDAPVLLLCHFPKMMKSAQWSDVGMWLQTIMLLFRGEGLDTCPLEVLGMYGRTIKAHLGLSEDTLLFCGLAIGWRDAEAAVNQFERERVALCDNVTFQGF